MSSHGKGAADRVVYVSDPVHRKLRALAGAMRCGTGKVIESLLWATGHLQRPELPAPEEGKEP
jgi:hypothetical protein